jgi:hypothetical protein
MAIPRRVTSGYTERKIPPTASVDIPAEPEPERSPQADAGAAAARAISRYNVERRKAGEPPLDLQGSERFRNILVEVIGRLEFAKGGETTGHIEN